MPIGAGGKESNRANISGNRSGNGWGGEMTPGGCWEHSKGESTNLSISSSQSKVADGRNSESLSFRSAYLFKVIGTSLRLSRVHLSMEKQKMISAGKKINKSCDKAANMKLSSFDSIETVCRVMACPARRQLTSFQQKLKPPGQVIKSTKNKDKGSSAKLPVVTAATAFPAKTSEQRYPLR
jgi:hypothetical protein